MVEAAGHKRDSTPNTMETEVGNLKILITGASGLLGSKLSELATRQGHEVYSAYNQNRPLHGNPIKLDVTSRDNIDQALEYSRPEIIFHVAALTKVDECERNKELAWKTNYEGPLNIMRAAEKTESFLVYCSTDYVFDGEKGLYSEGDKPDPINHYGYTKLKGERAIEEYGGEWTIVRPSVIYGAHQATGKVNFALWILDKLRKGEEVKVLKDQYVSPTLSTSLATMMLETQG